MQITMWAILELITAVLQSVTWHNQGVMETKGLLIYWCCVIVATGLQLAAGFMAKHKVQEKKYEGVIIWMYLAITIGAMYLFATPSSIMLLILPVINYMSGKMFRNEIHKRMTTAEFLLILSSGSVIYFVRLILGYKMQTQTVFVADMFIFLTLTFLILYQFGEIKHKNLALNEDVKSAVDNSKRDSMTKLYNKAALIDELSTLQKGITTFSVIIMDIDNFKRVNDTYGHAFGDVVIKNLAKTLIENIRGIDKAYRYGGEEFMVILPKTELDGARSSAERIRRAFYAIEYEVEGEKLHFSVSIGIAACKHKQYDTPMALIEKCDAALYKAKRNGKNRVEE